MCFWWFPPSFHKVMNGCNNIANLNPSAGGLLCTSSLIVSGQSIPQCIEKSCDLKCVQWTCTYFWEFLQVMIWMSVQWEPKSHRLGLTVRRGSWLLSERGKRHQDVVIWCTRVILSRQKLGSLGVSWISCDEQHLEQGYLCHRECVFVFVHAHVCVRDGEEEMLLSVVLWGVAPHKKNVFLTVSFLLYCNIDTNNRRTFVLASKINE